MPLPPIKPKPPAAAARAEILPRRRLILAALLCLACPAALWAQPLAPANAAPLSTADQALLTQVEAYLNSQGAIQADFLQVADDGSTRTGKAWMERPGRMRFEYDPPDPQLLVAGSGALIYHDPQLNQTSNIPLASTPLGILLSAHVDFNQAGVTVTNIQRLPGEIDITLVRNAQASAGRLTLVFGTNPLELRQWVVMDAQGRQTRVSLYDITQTGPLPDKLFQYSLGPSSNRKGG